MGRFSSRQNNGWQKGSMGILTTATVGRISLQKWSTYYFNLGWSCLLLFIPHPFFPFYVSPSVSKSGINQALLCFLFFSCPQNFWCHMLQFSLLWFLHQSNDSWNVSKCLIHWWQLILFWCYYGFILPSFWWSFGRGNGRWASMINPCPQSDILNRKSRVHLKVSIILC